MQVLIYSGKPEDREGLYEAVKRGAMLLCPKCMSELIVALDAETASAKKVHPGIYCSKYPNHFFEMIELRRPTTNGVDKPVW